MTLLDHMKQQQYTGQNLQYVQPGHKNNIVLP